MELRVSENYESSIIETSSDLTTKSSFIFGNFREMLVNVWQAFGVVLENLRKIANRSDEGLTLETLAFESLYGGQFTLYQLS